VKDFIKTKIFKKKYKNVANFEALWYNGSQVKRKDCLNMANKKKKRRINYKTLTALILFLIAIIGACIGGWFFHLKQVEIAKAKELEEQELANKKYPIEEEDFKEGLLDGDYKLASVDIGKDSLVFKLLDVDEDDYKNLCMNLDEKMKSFEKEGNRENYFQTNATFYIYKETNLEDAVATIEYEINSNTAYVTTMQTLPSINKADGLLTYEFLDFDGQTLQISMDLFSLTLYEKIAQMKTFYEVAMDMNNISNLILDVKDKNVDYLYNNTNEMTIITKLEF
jgi:hypothetical protein